METITDSQLMSVVPNVLKSIPITDLRDAFSYFRNGHTLDGVTKVSPRFDDEEALEALEDALKMLARELYDGQHISVYRTVEFEDIPDLSKPTHLGIYWSSSEMHTMGDPDENTMLFTGHVALDAIDWSETIPLFYDCHEYEIRLRRGAKIEDVTGSFDIDINPIQYA